MRIITEARSEMNPTLGFYVTTYEIAEPFDGGVMHLKKGGGGGSQTTQTIQKADPWVGQQPFLTDLMNRASTNSQTPNQFFPGSTIAPESQNTIDARTTLEGTVPQQTNLANEAVAGNIRALNASDITNNPALDAAAAGAIRPVEQALLERILPSVRGGAIEAGAFGGSRQGVLESNAIRDATQAMIDRTAGLYSEAYGQGLDAQGKALLTTPGTLQATTAPGLTLSALGQQEQARQQALINEQISRHDFDQNEETIRLANFQNLISGSFGGQGSSSSSTDGGGSSSGGLGGAISGGIGGYGLATALGASGPVGWAAAGLGALLGAF